VGTFRFSNRALSDLDSIVAFTIETWGDRQAATYLAQLEAATQRLAERTTLGRRCEHIRPGLWRMEEGSHVLFFRREGADVLVCRILHYRMLPKLHAIDDDE
jgi:toxin ParE1/3/4